MEKHFVTFYSPGTFVSEETTKEVTTWDVDEALEIANGIKERHNATPYGFQFHTRSRKDDDLDSHVSERSAMYYLGGQVRTIDDVRNDNDPNEATLLWNMETNGYDRIITNTNSWKFTAPLREDDVVLDWEPTAENVVKP